MIEQFCYLRRDLRRWKYSSTKELFYIIFEQGVWATVFYRIGRMLFLVDIPVIRIIFRLIAFIVLKFSEIFLAASIKPGTNIGPGLYIGHTGALIIHPEVIAGKNLSIGTGTVIGTRGVGNRGVPTIGDNVYVGVGAKILGKITIGNNVKIGANAVVLADVPDDATVVGIPARIITKKDKPT